jgi:hypothetical protein
VSRTIVAKYNTISSQYEYDLFYESSGIGWFSIATTGGSDGD